MENYRLAVYFHSRSHYDFTFIMKLIASINEDTNNDNLEVIFTPKDKEIKIEYHGIRFKDSLKLISSPLKTIVVQTLGNDLDHTNIPRLNLDAIARNGGNSGMTNTSICCHGRNPYSILSSNHTHS